MVRGPATGRTFSRRRWAAVTRSMNGVRSAGSGPTTPWCSRTPPCATRWPFSGGPRRAPACDRATASSGPCFLACGTAGRRPLPSSNPRPSFAGPRRLPAVLDLEESAERTRPPSCRAGGARTHPADGRGPSPVEPGTVGDTVVGSLATACPSCVLPKNPCPGSPTIAPVPAAKLDGMTHRALEPGSRVAREAIPGYLRNRPLPLRVSLPCTSKMAALSYRIPM